MRIKAYILAADPAWIEASVQPYYGLVDEILVIYDQNKKGWTGAPIQVDACIDRLQAIDCDRKMRLVSGDFARLNHSPMANDTFQRQTAIDIIGDTADWILQIDADEILPNGAEFIRYLHEYVPPEYQAVDWPMRTFFNRSVNGPFLEIATYRRRQISAYPGPIAIRNTTQLRLARQTTAQSYRFDVRSQDTDPANGGRPVHHVIPEDQAILHLSWIRTEEQIRSKLTSWSHSDDFNWMRYIDRVWLTAPRRWRWMYRFHPFRPKWWPALREVEIPPRLLGTEAGL